jgi:segregation and condensation protein B
MGGVDPGGLVDPGGAADLAADRGADPALAALAGAVESILFVAGGPVRPEALAAATGADLERIREALGIVRGWTSGGGLLLQAVAGGYQLATRPEHADAVKRFLQAEHAEKLTRGALETLAIIAYRQPITRGEVEHVRGVRSDWHIERLLERQLIREVGRRQTLGRPVEFGTTELFLRYFGLAELSQLPAVGERGVQTLLEAAR